GSYVLIPRGTPHAQGNFSTHPVRLLTMFTPVGSIASSQSGSSGVRVSSSQRPRRRLRRSMLRWTYPCGCRKQRAHLVYQLGGTGRFGKNGIVKRCLRRIQITTGVQKNGNVMRLSMRTEMSAQIEPGGFGHLVIGDNQIRQLPRHELQRLCDPSRRDHLEPFRGQKQPQQCERIRRVIHHQDACLPPRRAHANRFLRPHFRLSQSRSSHLKWRSTLHTALRSAAGPHSKHTPDALTRSLPTETPQEMCRNQKQRQCPGPERRERNRFRPHIQRIQPRTTVEMPHSGAAQKFADRAAPAAWPYRKQSTCP